MEAYLTLLRSVNASLREMSTDEVRVIASDRSEKMVPGRPSWFGAALVELQRRGVSV